MAEIKSFKLRDGVSVTEEVVAIIAGLAATEVEGVASLEGNLKNKMIEKAGYNKLSKGVRIISKGEKNIVVRLCINVEYGHEIEGVGTKVQDKVMSTVYNMTGITVDEVDIKISSVILENIE